LEMKRKKLILKAAALTQTVTWKIRGKVLILKEWMLSLSFQELKQIKIDLAVWSERSQELRAKITRKCSRPKTHAKHMVTIHSITSTDKLPTWTMVARWNLNSLTLI
jgi:hypothetical protein